jgi:AcrR family transcriptional regulator
MGTRHRTASQEIEGKVLSAALDLLDTEGVDGLTVRSIAARAGIAPMGIYTRFENKMGVYGALWTEGFDRLIAAMDAVPPSGDARRELIECGLAYRKFALANVAHYRLMFLDTACDFQPDESGTHAAARALQILVDRVEGAQTAGALPNGRSIDLAMAFWSCVHGFVALEMVGMNFAIDRDSSYAIMLDGLVLGLSQL